MKLHHYCHFDKARDILTRGSLVPSSPLSFNDPFECCWEMVGDYTREQAKRDVQARIGDPNLFLELKAQKPEIETQADFDRHITQNLERFADLMLLNVQDWTYLDFAATNKANKEKNLRILCFCDADHATSELLMWAHYTRGHKGARLLLEFSEAVETATQLNSVKYRPDRVKMKRGWQYPSPAMVAAVRESLYSKSAQWHYEQEYRMVFESVDGSPFRKNSELELPIASLVLKCVDYGLGLTKDDRAVLEELVRQKYPTTMRRDASIHPSRYELVYRDITGGGPQT
jgi:hypothetical protein